MSQKKKTATKGKKTNQEDILIDMMKDYPLLRTDADIYAKVIRNGKPCNLSLNSEEFSLFIKSEFKEQTGSFPKGTTMKDCIDYIKNFAYGKEITKAKHRISSYDDGSIIYDLSNGKCVKINKVGWKIEDNNYPMFIQSKDQLPQVTPIRSERGWERIYKYLNISEEEKLLLVVYIISCFNPNISFPTISVNGTNGSGKSTLSRIIKKIIDPSISELESFPDCLNNLKVRLNASYYTAFDNLSKLSQKQSEFLCKVVTGTTTTERQYYTNCEINCTHLKSGMCLNGISNFIFTAEFIQRTLFFNTKLIKGTTRITDNEIWESFNMDLPYILGGIFDLLSKALVILPNVKIENKTRLADFHEFAYSVAEAMGGKGKEFDEILRRNAERQSEITCENAMLIRLLLDFLKENDGEWKSTMSLLYKSLRDFMNESDEFDYNRSLFPKMSNHFSAELKKYEAALASKGVNLFIKKNSKGYSEINITTDWIIRKPIKIGRKPIILNTNKKREFIAKLIDESITNAECN